MEVILKTDVPKLGKAGSVVNVKDGFGRNFLIPNGLAVASNAANLRKLEEEKIKTSRRQEKAKLEAEDLKNKLAALSLTLPVLVQEQDPEKLYGSVSALELERALKEEGFQIDKNTILLDDPIKALGIYEVPVRLHPEVQAKIKVWIVKK